ncbi:hypothetical protein DFH28DRAFT_1083698 [Melampsora americana]|nr:hypothetical protein DFH28DRAFT_1083698 [Melampsora americana]
MDSSKSLFILASSFILLVLPWNQTLSMQIPSVAQENSLLEQVMHRDPQFQDISEPQGLKKISRKRPREDSQDIYLRTLHLKTKQNSLGYLKGKIIKASDCFVKKNQDSAQYINEVKQKKIKNEKRTQDLIESFQSCTSPIQKVHHLMSLKKPSRSMPTSMIQVTWFGLITHTKTLIRKFDIGEICHSYDQLESLTRSYDFGMKKRIGSRRKTGPGKQLNSIFTMEGQKRLGDFGIKLEKDWSGFEQNQLFEFWAYYLNIYLEVSGNMKALLETQVIMTNLIKTEAKVTNFLDKVDQLFPIFPDWSDSSIQTHKRSLVNCIRSLKEE